MDPIFVCSLYLMSWGDGCADWVCGRRSLFFFGGLSIHLSTALLAHMFSYNMCVSILLLCCRIDSMRIAGRGDQPSKKSSARHSGSKVGVVIGVHSPSCVS